MIIRIVKMQFREDVIDDFLALFQRQKGKIRQAAGCRYLALWQGSGDNSLYFTCSHWETEQDLENYRHSIIFENTWSQTKKLFAARPEAWSVESVTVL